MLRPRRIDPTPGQESVWDYPRPPRVHDVMKPVRVELGGEIVAATTRAKRVLETSHPPVYYIAPEDIRTELLRPGASSSHCEFKGMAAYYDLAVGDRVSRDAGWYYPDPTPGFEELRGWVAFYPSRVDACYVGEERVRAREGGFYGGWVTDEIVGPFKGGAGTRWW